ncbi:hypothetical protein O5833_28635, partial [Escherichia coli]|nr:hypothetical protein [Escherichia coli]
MRVITLAGSPRFPSRSSSLLSAYTRAMPRPDLPEKSLRQ